MIYFITSFLSLTLKKEKNLIEKNLFTCKHNYILNTHKIGLIASCCEILGTPNFSWHVVERPRY